MNSLVTISQQKLLELFSVHSTVYSISVQYSVLYSVEYQCRVSVQSISVEYQYTVVKSEQQEDNSKCDIFSLFLLHPQG